MENENLSVTADTDIANVAANNDAADTPMLMSSKDMMEISDTISEAKKQIQEISSITKTLLVAKYECTDEDADRFFDKMRNLVTNGRSNDYTTDEKNEFFRNEDGTDYSNEDALRSLDDINTMDEFRAAIFDDLIESAIEEKNQIENLKKIEDDFEAKKDAQIKYLNSAEYREKKEQSYRELEKKYNEETDPAVKKELKKTYDFLTSMRTFDYLFAVLAKDPSEFGKRNILDTFFDSTRSKYILKRYVTRFEQLRKRKKFNVDPNSILYFIHLECKLLDEKYHIMDGFFVFNVIKYIAYIDSDNDRDLMFVQNILLNLKKLFYHEFPSVEDEQKFVKVITDFEDMFLQYSDDFTENNGVYRDYVAEERDKELEKNSATIKNSDGVEYTVTVDKNDAGGFKIYVNGNPVIKPSELNPPSNSICYLKTTGADEDKPEVVDTKIPIDEFKAVVEKIGQ